MENSNIKDIIGESRREWHLRSCFKTLKEGALGLEIVRHAVAEIGCKDLARFRAVCNEADGPHWPVGVRAQFLL